MRARGVILALGLAACPNGTSTHLAGDASVTDAASPDAPADATPSTTRFTILADPQLAAASAMVHPVIVTAIEDDGSPAKEQIVLNIDRPGAGHYTRPTFVLDDLGGTTGFVPCDLSTPGCAGPLTLTVARASAPNTPVAHLDVELVDPATVDPARACLGGGNVLHLEGNDQIFTGSTTISNATWEVLLGYNEVAQLKVTPAGGSGAWTLLFDTRVHVQLLYPGLYEDATKAYAAPYGEVFDHPALDIAGFGHTCTEVAGSFRVGDYRIDGNGLAEATMTFEQFCDGNAINRISGCFHYER